MYNICSTILKYNHIYVVICCVCVYVSFYQDLVGKYSQQMVKGMLQLLSNCPSETAHLRKELLIAAKHILTTDLRSRMYTHTETHVWTGLTQESEKGFFFLSSPMKVVDIEDFPQIPAKSHLIFHI